MIPPHRDPRPCPPRLRAVLAVVGVAAAFLVSGATVASAAPADNTGSAHAVQANDVSSWS